MAVVNVTIKNSGKTYNLEVDLEDSAETFKMQISSLTDIPPEKQKVMLKGGLLKDEPDLSKFNIKEGQTIMVLGSPESKLNEVNKVDKTHLFAEDSKIEVRANLNPIGLTNLGNTCYLNSSLQSLFKIKEVQDSLKNFDLSSTSVSSNKKQIVESLKKLFKQLEDDKSKGVAISPSNFLALFRLFYSQFAEIDRASGRYKQQDAEEAFSSILNLLFEFFPNLRSSFQIEFKTESRCLEVGGTSEGDDQLTIGYEDASKLSCHITGQTNFLKNGLIESLKEKIEKHNPVLDRNSEYEISKKITKLPKYLEINYVRFFWKRDIGKKAKILRKVQFPFELDVSDLLDESIKSTRVKSRDSFYKIEKSNEEELRNFKKTKKNNGDSKIQELTEDELLNKLNNNYLTSMSEEEKKLSEKGENPSSLYELISVVAHQGSSADSGHYQCFNKDLKDLTGETWYKFNDDKVSIVSRDKIESLAGGGESDSALILIYKAVGL